MKILVTGATGFIGSHIVEELAKQGISLRAAYAPGQDIHEVDSDFLIDGLDLDSFPLDITDRKAVFENLKGCQILFHCDYLFSTDPKDKERLYGLHQRGTANLMDAALSHGVEKVIYTSGIETLSIPKGQEQGRERDGVIWEDLKSHFEKSRYLAEREVLNFKAKGLPTIILHPTLCLGSREGESTPLGRYLHRLLRGKSRFYLDTGLNLVDVQDVAKGHLLAAKRAKPGTRYILGNQNVYLLEFLQKIEAFTGMKAVGTALPFGAAKVGNFLARGLLRRRSGIPNAWVNRLQTPQFFDSSLARKELGLPQSDVWAALKDQLDEILQK